MTVLVGGLRVLGANAGGPWTRDVPLRGGSLPRAALARWDALSDGLRHDGIDGFVAAYGEPKYPRDFRHFDYVNPDAPKGGTLYLPNPDRRQSFDKYNTFTICNICSYTFKTSRKFIEIF